MTPRCFNCLKRRNFSKAKQRSRGILKEQNKELVNTKLARVPCAFCEEENNSSLPNQVTYEEMAAAMEQAGVGIPSTDIVSLLNSEDYTGGGKISLSEFRAISKTPGQ